MLTGAFDLAVTGISGMFTTCNGNVLIYLHLSLKTVCLCFPIKYIIIEYIILHLIVFLICLYMECFYHYYLVKTVAPSTNSIAPKGKYAVFGNNELQKLSDSG